MGMINTSRVWIGALVGTIVWVAWSTLINFLVLADRYADAQKAGWFLQDPRYPYFLGVWIVTLFVLSLIIACFYAATRATFGAGPGTALKVGLAVGFAAGFPICFSIAAWSVIDRIFPLWWMLELWVGSILSAFVSGWLYREQT